MSQPAPARPDSLRSVLGAAVLLALALLAVASVKSHRDLAAAQAREQALKATIEATKGRIAVLSNRIERLRHDPATLERLAREDLGLVRPHDLVIALPADGPPPPRLPRPAMPQPPALTAAAPPPTASEALPAVGGAAPAPVATEPASTGPALPPAPVPASTSSGPAAPAQPPAAATGPIDTAALPPP